MNCVDKLFLQYMARKFQFAVDEFYHLYNRGNDKRVIFVDDSDKERLLKLLYLCNSADPFVFRDITEVESMAWKTSTDTLTDIGAYCLMPNHFHLLVHEKEENGISRFMQKLSTAYTMYFNKKHKRHGALFEGRFKATHAEEDRYLEYLFAYIHLNPIKLIDPDWKERGLADVEGSEQFLNSYSYSSYWDYIGRKREEATILNRLAFPEYFGSAKDFRSFLNSWLNFSSESFT